MLQAIGKFVGGKVLTAILTVTVALVVIWYYRMDPAQREAIWATARSALVWIGLAIVLPWGLFFVPPLVMKAESNLASAAMLVGYLAVDAVLALWLAEWSIPGTLNRALLVLALACAAVYNLLVCEYLATLSEDTP